MKEEKKKKVPVWLPALDILLEGYEPAVRDADTYLSTMDIISSLERHFGVPQGDPEFSLVDGVILFQELTTRGYLYRNTGGAQLHWLLKKSK